MMFSTGLDYLCGGIISRPGASSRMRRTALVAAILGDLGLLAFFKYYTFTAENLNRLYSLLGGSGHGMLPVFAVALPIGISFYTFESMSYTIDIYRGIVKPARSLSDLSCFISLFPHLVAGPIVRYNIIAEQLQHREHTLEKFTEGVSLFILGFAKKILLANPMGSVADAVFNASAPYTLDAWVGVIAYAFQI
jgi:alginate O-acetyltransferase complex protein AlgI